MLNCIAYELGNKIPYPVTQIRWEGDEKYIAFNSSWHKEDECILCAGTGMRDSDKNEIYEGDVLQLTIQDDSCYHKNEIGIVYFCEGRFCWSPVGGWQSYSLAGKSWKKIGNKAHIIDIRKYYTEEAMYKDSHLMAALRSLFTHYKGVLIEKYKPIKESIKIPYSNKAPYSPSIVHETEKQRKKILHQYKNYLKIKSMIEASELNPEILNSNL